MTSIGQPVDRVDGPLKVTGRATYAYEQWEAGRPLYGFIVGATIGRGRITAIDASRAEAAPGVRLVMTYQNAPAQGIPDESLFVPYLRAQPMLSGSEIHHYGEPVALVVAETLEQARAAAGLVDVEYAAEAGRFDFAAHQDQAYIPQRVKIWETDTALGDVEAAFGGAEVTVDERYTTPYEFSQPLELHACLAVWDGEDLTLYVGAQTISAVRTAVASTLGLDPARVQVVSPYTGGGFGSKVSTHAETILAALAARQLGQPVKVGLTRQQTFHLVGMRATTSQRVRLGAHRDGRLVAIAHEANVFVSPHEEWVENAAMTTHSLYAAPNRLTRHRATALDLQAPEDVRGPGEGPGLLAVESAMDELAHALGLDPIELRVRNEPTLDPMRGVPFSERRLIECLREGARRFGWERRPARPATLRDGRWLVGYGTAAGIRMHFQGPTVASVRLGPDASAVVRTDMTDIGTGTYTILAQVAADGLGLPVERVRVELGRSELPLSSGSGGSWGAGNASSALQRACGALRVGLLAAAVEDPASPLFDLDPAGAVYSDGNVTIGGASEALGTIVARSFPSGPDAEGETVGMEREESYQACSIHTYGAHFAEVGVDVDTAEIRLRRMLGVFSAGRILNPKTARSQLIGGMIWGVSMALHEEAVVDPRTGAFVNRDLGEYLVPVHADIPAIDAILLDGFDGKANPLGVKGVGELGICGSGAAVANAVFNATGVRVRDFPITLDKLLPGLPLPAD
jgi:xanthine dehydrogenase YagR molybdenum-binding subunit